MEGCLGFSRITRSSSNVQRGSNGGSSTFRFSLGLDQTIGDGVTRFGAAETEVVVEAALVLFRFQFAVFFKVSVFRVTPGKSVLMNHYELVHEISFDWPKEVARMCLVNVFFAFEGISSMRVKWFWVLR